MNDKQIDPDSPEVLQTMRALGESESETTSANVNDGPAVSGTRRTAVAIKQAYSDAPLPEPSVELRATIDDQLNQLPQPTAEKPMKTSSARMSGVWVMTTSVAIVAVVVTLLWQFGDGNWQTAQRQFRQISVDQPSSPDEGSAATADDLDGLKSQLGNLSAPRGVVVLTDGSESMPTTEIPPGQTVLGTEAPEVNEPLAGTGVYWHADRSDTKHFPVAPKPGAYANQPNYGLQGALAQPSRPYTSTSDVDVFIEETKTGRYYYAAGQGQQGGQQGASQGSGQGQGAPVTIGLDPTGKPTADFDIAFRKVGGEVAAPEPPAPKPEEGRGPESHGERYERIYENTFKAVGAHPLSTFSIDVDTASYSKVRQYLNEHRQLPPPDAVRIEELVNYFPYDYLPPMGAEPFTAHMEVSECPWRPEHRLARIAIKGREIKSDRRPASNLVFLLDVSGSMNQPNKLPLVKKGMRMLVDGLGETDRVAIVTYQGNAGLVLESTPGDKKAEIKAALDELQPGGSTAGAAGIKLAYEIARENFIEKGVNRVLLCTDGDFNVGTSSTSDLVRLAEEEAKNHVFLSILGFGMGNLNDSMLEQVSGKANGMYAFVDTEKEARKVLVEQMSGTLVTIAKDVKIQIEFNPAKVKGYRLIGYENRILAAEDFNDDTKDAGEIGAGHNVTALYEIVPADAKVEVDAAEIDELKYQKPAALTDAAESDELLTLKLRYKQPDGDKSSLVSFPVEDDTQRFAEASDDFQFAASVASFGMLLRGSRYAGDATLDGVLETASESVGDDQWGYRAEFVELVKHAKEATQ